MVCRVIIGWMLLGAAVLLGVVAVCVSRWAGVDEYSSTPRSVGFVLAVDATLIALGGLLLVVAGE
jgi:hypothetical protein